MKELLLKNGIATNSIHPVKKRQLSILARALNSQSRKKYITIAALRTVLYSWFNKETIDRPLLNVFKRDAFSMLSSSPSNFTTMSKVKSQNRFAITPDLLKTF